MDFRDRLRDQIEYCGLLDKEVADRAGISKRAIDSYVGSRGCIPAADIAVKLAKVLGSSVEYLVTGEDSSIKNVIPENSELKHINSYETKAERKLIKYFINLSEKDKNTVIALAEYLNRISKND